MEFAGVSISTGEAPVDPREGACAPQAQLQTYDEVHSFNRGALGQRKLRSENSSQANGR